MWLSGLCAIHCLLTPLIVVALPFAGISMIQNHTTEYILFSISFIFALSTLIRSYFKTHRNISIVLITLTGFALIVAAHMFHVSLMLETILSVAGSLLIIYGLFRNQMLIRTCSRA